MKLLLRLWHELNTLQSWLFDGEPHIDGHLWIPIELRKVGDKYQVIDQCTCGKKGKSWMREMMYLRMKDQLPKLTTKGDKWQNHQ